MGWNSQIVVASIVIVEGPTAAIFIYNGPPATGNLIGSWAAQAGTDQYGNPYPAGISASQGSLSGLTITNSQLIGALISGGVINNPLISAPTVSGGTITEATVTFDSTAGALFCYTTSTTTVTQTAAGNYTFTVPVNVTSLNVKCTGAGAGGNGGDSGDGGHGGGGGEFAQEPNYPVTPATVLAYTVGAGGSNSVSGGGDGDDGGDTFFDLANGGVLANGGNGDGTKGTGSTATVHKDGGAGGTASSTGGGGGGGSGGSTGTGGAGSNSSSSTGANGGAAGTGGGAAGGKGGNNTANGSNGSAPGGGGGGAGAGSSTNTVVKTYTCTDTYTYQGSDGANPNQLINHNGTAYQGGNQADTFNGKAKTWIVFNASQIQSDLSGNSINYTRLTLNNNHTWYNSGMTVAVGWDTKSSFGSTAGDPSGGNIDNVEFHVDEGATVTQGISGLGTAFKNGTAANVVLFKNSSSLTYYGYFAGKSQSGPPKLTISYNTGSGSTSSGAGADGQVTITYATSSVLVMSISPVAGTDAFGNSYPAGIMTDAINAPVVAIDPVNGGPETWHAASLVNSWANSGSGPNMQYRMLASPPATVEVIGDVNAGTLTSPTTIFTLPSGYRPAKAQAYTPIASGGGSGLTVGTSRIVFNTNGTVTATGMAGFTAGGRIFIHYFLSLDA